MRSLRLVLGGLLLVIPGRGFATDPPHDVSTAPAISCPSCHTLHKSEGGHITSVSGNANLCESCHSSRGPAFGFPWVSSDQAVPGAHGNSHRWDAQAVSAAHGAQVPTTPAMANRLESGKLMCSTCHDVHNGATLHGGTQHTSVTPGVAIARVAGGGTGTLSLNPPAAAALARGYLLEVVTAGGVGTSRFRVSNDNGTSWYGWNGSTWVAGLATGRPTGAGVALNDGANVAMTFTGNFAVGDRWRFYISYPFLRMTNAASQMCEDCHAPRVHSALRVEGQDPSYLADESRLFSHPVGEALARSYDRTGGVLDADGNLQSGAGDGLKTNNLNFDSAGKVRCLTCHYPHQADSNSLTEDAR